jgi:putative hemolysin
MELIKPKDLIKAKPELNFPGGIFFARLIMRIFGINKLNKIYAKIEKKQGIGFIEELVKILELKIEFDETRMTRIPASGPVIIIANRPLGGLEGLILVKLIFSVRKDVKILANPMLKKAVQVSEFLIDTNPFEPDRPDKSTFSGLKESILHIKNGGVLCLFPAKETNTWDETRMVTDKIWRISVIKLIKKMEVPVIPVLFQLKYGRIFRLISKLHPSLKDARLPSEIFRKRNKHIVVRIGNVIKKADQDKFNDIYQFGRYLRAKTYGMAGTMEIRRFFLYTLKPPVRPMPVIDAVPKELILKEVQAIRHSNLLFKLSDYSVFVVPTREIPQILTEIGRQREITFREVGEGTNQSIDIEEFDLYYHQMFIWDDKNERIVGAYRIGFGDEIMAQFGKQGFYVHTLFRMDDSMREVLEHCIEVGRSFIVREYQKKPMSLFLLWKGFLYLLLKNPDKRYLIGPVSISNNYSRLSKDLIIRFIMENHNDWHFAQKVKPRKAYKFRSEDPHIHILMDSTGSDINKLDKTIGDMDALNSGLPVLIKKYIQLGAKIVSFNVDPKFNNCVDGLVILDVYDIPKSALESFSKDVNDSEILERFYAGKE